MCELSNKYACSYSSGKRSRHRPVTRGTAGEARTRRRRPSSSLDPPSAEYLLFFRFTFPHLYLLDTSNEGSAECSPPAMDGTESPAAGGQPRVEKRETRSTERRPPSSARAAERLPYAVRPPLATNNVGWGRNRMHPHEK